LREGEFFGLNGREGISEVIVCLPLWRIVTSGERVMENDLD
jgi:hypothetical protein